MRGLFYTSLVVAILTRGESIQAKLSVKVPTIVEPRMRLLRGDEPAADDLLASDGERARLGNVAKLLKERKAFRKELFAAAKANEKLKLPTVSLQQNKFNELFKNGLTPKQAFELGKFKTRVEAKKYEKYYELAKAKLAAKERMARMVQIREARAERMRQAGTKAIIRDN